MGRISRSGIAAEILPLSSQRPWVAGMSLLNHHVAKPQRLVLPVFLFSLPTIFVLSRSLMVKLASYLALDAVRSVGVRDVSQAGLPLPPTNALFTPPSHPKHLLHIVLFNTCQLLILPCATGMTISLVLLALCSYRPRCRAVIWLRIDQKTCLKSIYTAGCTAHVVSNRIEGDNVVTDLEGLAAAIAEIGADNVLAVISTTSCFAPRRPDDVKSVAKLCKDAQIPHVVNHAYGLQDAQTNKLLCSAGSFPYFERRIDRTHCECSFSATVGRVDCVISSTDKNFLVCADFCVFETHVSSSKKSCGNFSMTLHSFFLQVPVGGCLLYQLKTVDPPPAQGDSALVHRVSSLCESFALMLKPICQ